MTKRIDRKHERVSFSSRVFWAIMAVAIGLAMTAGAVAFSLRHHHVVPDIKLYFVFGAALLAVVLLMIAQVWRAAIKRLR